MTSAIQSTQLSERLGSLDFLRGIAVMGILIINAEFFCYPDSWSPFKYGFASETDVWTRFGVYFFAQGKFFSMFTLLFGVGFGIFLDRLVQKGAGIRAVDLYAKRLLWLFVIGSIHSYLIWNGDILHHYATIGFLLFPFRTMRIRYILLLLLVPVGILLFNTAGKALDHQDLFEKCQQAIVLAPQARTEEQQAHVDAWQKKIQKGTANGKAVQTVRMTYWESIVENASQTGIHKGEVLHTGIFFTTFLMMVLGIVLYKAGVFKDYRRLPYYWPLTFVVLGLALLFNWYKYYHWSFEYNIPIRNVGTAWLMTFHRESLGLAYVLLLNGVYQKFLSKIRIRVVENLGRMALSNYIFQSIACGLIFYGYGFGMYNRFTRSELLLVIVSIWVMQMVLSWLWLKRYQKGPLEWLWRRLTYWQPQSKT